MAMVLCPRNARPVAMFALVVVLPTPPLPEVMTTILDTGASFAFLLRRDAVSMKRSVVGRGKFLLAKWGESERQDAEATVLDEQLRRSLPPVGGDLVGGQVLAVDRDQLGLE